MVSSFEGVEVLGIVGRGLDSQLFARHGIDKQSMLHEPIEQLSSASRRATVEAKRVLVEVVRKMRGTDRPLVGSKQPPLEKRGDQMRQLQIAWRNDAARVAVPRQWVVSSPVVGDDDASRLHGLLDERDQAGRASVLDDLKPDAPDPIVLLVLDSDGDHGLPFGSASALPALRRAEVGFVGLDKARKAVPVRPDHGPPEFVEPLPSGLVSPELQLAHHSQGVAAVLLADDVPHDPKPERQRFARSMKQRSRRDRRLDAAADAIPQQPSRAPSAGAAAARTAKALRPTQLGQIVQAGPLRAEASQQFGQGFRIVLHGRPYYI